MKNIYNLLACAILIGVSGCSSEDDSALEPSDKDKVEVSITTEILTRASVTTAFRQGDAMNLYAKTYGKIDAPDMVENIKAVYDGSGWTVTPAIKLGKNGKSFIYAVYPYTEGLKDLANVPVDLDEQQDVLYSGSFVPVTYTTHTAKLTMKHALALVSFNISNQGYAGAGKVQAAGLAGEEVFATGAMNVQTGKVIGKEKKELKVDVNKVVVGNGWTDDLPRIWAIPFSTKVKKALLTMTIDGKDYQAQFPEVEMQGGYQYIFRLVLTVHGLEFIPDQTQTLSLNQETDQIENLQGHGVLRLVHTASDFRLPLLLGDNVFGVVNWGDDTTDSYSLRGSHEYSTSVERDVSIESWNSTGFELQTLTDIEVIDVSAY